MLLLSNNDTQILLALSICLPSLLSSISRSISRKFDRSGSSSTPSIYTGEHSDLLVASNVATGEVKPIPLLSSICTCALTCARAIIATNIGDVRYFTLSQTLSDNKDDLYRDSTAKYVGHPVLELTVVAILG